MTATAGYDRELEWNEPPTPSECRYARFTVVRAAGPPAPAWRPLARIGAVDLYLAPPGSERDAPAASVTPVLAGKRGRRRSGDYVGVDGQIGLPDFHDVGDLDVGGLDVGGLDVGSRAPAPPAAPFTFASPATARDPRAIAVAIVDVSFDNLEVLRDLGGDGAGVDGPYAVGLADEQARPSLSRAPGHGTCMAGILLAEVPAVRVGLFRIPAVAGAARPYLAPTDLCAAIAAAVESWQADIVLVAMSDGAWGTPRHLRDVLREAARTGRAGRGTAIFCSVGDPSRNHARSSDSAVLGADDLASQPWVEAVAACDRRGRWYRVYPGYGAGAGATYNRFGPAVALSAPGEPRRYGGRIAADDSSQAAALAAAAAARVLAVNRELSVVELRALLALTADVPPVVDGGRGLAADLFDTRDRLGHSLKLGYGVVNARAACLAAADPLCLALLATRPVPDPDSGTTAGSRALVIAESWRAAVHREASRPDGGRAREYAAVAGRLSRLFLHSLPVQEALGWLARHLHALCEETGAAPSWWSKIQDHGALVERIRHALETLREALSPGDAPVAEWARRLDGVLADGGGGIGAAIRAFLATALSPVITGTGVGGPPSDDGQGG